MKFIQSKISRDELRKMSARFAGGLVKAVVDIEKNIMIVDVPMHADAEKELLDQGSSQENLWGINLYPDIIGDDFVEFDSMINVRPRVNNFTRGIESIDLQKKIKAVVRLLVI